MAARAPLVIVSGQVQQLAAADVLASASFDVNTILARRASITIENPTGAENRAIFFAPIAVTILQVRAVVQGSSSPSITYNIKYDTDRSAAGTSVTTSPSALTNTTTGVDATLNNVTVPANGWVWVVTTAQSGTTTELAVSIYYKPT